jgi:dynein heavy chain
VGPRSELEGWRARLAALACLADHLKTREARLVIGIAGAARTKAHKQWRETEPKVSIADVYFCSVPNLASTSCL